MAFLEEELRTAKHSLKTVSRGASTRVDKASSQLQNALERLRKAEAKAQSLRQNNKALASKLKEKTLILAEIERANVDTVEMSVHHAEALALLQDQIRSLEKQLSSSQKKVWATLHETKASSALQRRIPHLKRELQKERERGDQLAAELNRKEVSALAPALQNVYLLSAGVASLPWFFVFAVGT